MASGSRTRQPAAKAPSGDQGPATTTTRGTPQPARGAGQAPAPLDRRTALARGIVQLLQGCVADPSALEIVLGDPHAAEPGAGARRQPLVPVMGPPPPRATAIVRGPDAMVQLLFPPVPDALVEAFLRADVDIEGDVAAAVDAGRAVDLRRLGPDGARRLVRWGWELQRGGPTPAQQAGLGRVVGLARSPARGTAAPRLADTVPRLLDEGGSHVVAAWLDPRLTFSTAIFPDGTKPADAAAALDAAQEAKLELIVRKLRLGANRRLLDIGSGWGALVTYAGERHACLAVGVADREAHAAEANARARAAGLVGRVRTEVRDDVDIGALGRFDAVASVGIDERLGRADLSSFFRAAFGALRPGGLCLCQGLVASGTPARVAAPAPQRPASGSALDRFAPRGGEPVPLDELVARARAAGFDVVDVQSLHEDHLLTLAAWTARLEARWDDAVAAAGDTVARGWRLRLAAARSRFERGGLDACQLLLARPGEDGRTDLPPSPWW